MEVPTSGVVATTLSWEPTTKDSEVSVRLFLSLQCLDITSCRRTRHPAMIPSLMDPPMDLAEVLQETTSVLVARMGKTREIAAQNTWAQSANR